MTSDRYRLLPTERPPADYVRRLATVIDSLDLSADALVRLLGSLTYREQEILKLRLGIDCDCCYTLEEIGKIFKVTRERVRSVEKKAIRKVERILDRIVLRRIDPLAMKPVGTTR